MPSGRLQINKVKASRALVLIGSAGAGVNRGVLDFHEEALQRGSCYNKMAYKQIKTYIGGHGMPLGALYKTWPVKFQVIYMIYNQC